MIRFEKEPAVVLHRRLYRENHYLLDVITLNYGRIRATARIAKHKTYRLTENYAPFGLLNVSGQCKSELASFYNVQLQRRLVTEPLYFLNASYINELLIQLLPYGVPAAEIFTTYVSTIEQADTESLRHFEYLLIEFLDIFPQIEETGTYYQIEQKHGYPQFVPAATGYSHELVSRLQAKKCPENHPQLKKLLQEIIRLHKQYKPYARYTAISLNHLLRKN